MLLPNKGKILSLDIGTRRTGVAISNSDQQVAFIREEITHENQDELFDKLNIIKDREEIVGFLVGLPLNMQGKETQQTKYTLRVIETLNEFNLPIRKIDERLSSKEASAKQNNSKKPIDSQAAQILLESYLSSLPSNTDIPGRDSP